MVAHIVTAFTVDRTACMLLIYLESKYRLISSTQVPNSMVVWS